MAVAESIYQPQIAPGSTPATPQASPDAFGAGVGAGIAQLGGTLHEANIRAYRIERKAKADSEATDFNARFAAAREQLDQASIDARNNAPPGAAGHTEAMQGQWNAVRQHLLDGITEDSVRRQAAEQADEFGSRFVSSEYHFEAGARVGKMVTDQKDATDIGANRARRAHDQQSFAEELSLGRQAIDALQGVPAEVKEKLHKYHDETVSVGYLNGLNDTNPQAAKTLIDAGAFDSLLSPEQLDRARNGADVEIRRQTAIAEHQTALATAQLHDQVSTIKTLNSNGVEVPDDQITGLQNQLLTLKDKSGAIELEVMRTQNQVARETKPWTPIQYDKAINALAALSKRTPDQDLRLDYLRKIRGPRTAEFNNNPGGWAANNGTPPPPLDLSDPASIVARQSWARTISTQAGRPVPLLSQNEAATFAAEASASPKGRVGVADQLAAFGGASAMAAARQVAPSDPMLARLVLLPAADRAATINGAEARKANPALIDGKTGADARANFFAKLGAAAALLPEHDVGATFEVARNLYADWAARNGAQDYNDTQFDAAFHRALGGTINAQGQRAGGLGTWNRKPVLLPAGVTQDAFDRGISRYQPDPHNPKAPAYADGTPMPGDQLRRYTPVQRPDGFYEFHGPNGTVVHSRAHKVFLLSVAP